MPTMQVNIMPVMWQKSFGSKGTPRYQNEADDFK